MNFQVDTSLQWRSNLYSKEDLSFALEKSAERHGRLCPRQVLGVRMGLFGSKILDIQVPAYDKSILVILETDGCFADGIEVATGCSVGYRTLRIEDFGKVAASFVDIEKERVIRLGPRNDVRSRANLYCHILDNSYATQLIGYQNMPDEELFDCNFLELSISVREIISVPGHRVNCMTCG